MSRTIFFNNQWVYDASGNWTEMSAATFNNDDTGRKELRMDFHGGVENNQFFLQNCGFFDHYTQPGTAFKRQPGGKKPVIHLAQWQSHKKNGRLDAVKPKQDEITFGFDYRSKPGPDFNINTKSV